MKTDAQYMQQAIQLAKRGCYTTPPNPNVGCVLVRQGQIVGQGWHRRAGEAHAEVNALQRAGDKASGATAYVTLEPCSHTGKTPPCADALIKAGVQRVVVAMQDPNPLVAGRGLKKLAQAGIDVSCGLLETQARALNPGFIKRMETGRPFVRIKLGMSLDGRTAMASGESQWITGVQARRDVQFLRAQSSAILTGSGTVITDNPGLNVRLSKAELDIDGAVRQPLRVILDTRLQTPETAKIHTLEGETWLLASADAIKSSADKWRHTHSVLTAIAEDNGHLDLSAVMQYLAEQQINLLHVEAGSRLCGALLQAQLVDEIIVYMAPVIMGDEARGLFSLPGLAQMKDKIALHISELRKVGGDIRITAQPVYQTDNSTL